MKIGIIVAIALSIGVLAKPSFAQAIACGSSYTVVRGDTLGVISQRAYGPGQLSNFYALNTDVIGPNPDQIDIGMVLSVPCSFDVAEDVAATSALASQSAEQAETGTVSSAPVVEALPSPIATAEPETAATTEVETTAVAAPETAVPATSTTGEADFSAAPMENEAEPASPMPEGAEVVLTFNKASAPKFIINVGIIDPYLAKVSAVTEGRVQFIDPKMTNLDARAQLDLVTGGQADAAYVFNGYLEESHPLLQLPMQPLMGGTGYQTAIALWRLHENYLSTTDYLDGVHLLGFVGAPAAHIWRLREAPVKAGEDLVKTNEYTVPYFDGLDTRGAPAVREENASWLAAYDEEKGNPLTFAMAHGAARAGGIWNDKRTVTEIRNGVYTPTFSVVISDDAWARISPADQAAIMEISGEELAASSLKWDEFDNGHRRAMIEQGLDVVTADLELLAELQDRSRGGLDSWIVAADRSGISGYDAFQFYNQTLHDVALPSEF